MKHRPPVPDEWKLDDDGNLPLGRHHTFVIVDPVQLFDLAAEAPVRAAQLAREGWTTLNNGQHRLRREFVAATYAIAYHLLMDEFEMRRFFDQTAWGKTKPNPRSDKVLPRLLSYVFRFMVSIKQTGTDNRAYVYAASLQPYFNKGTKPLEMRQIIMELGLEKIRNLGVKQRKQAKEEAMKPTRGEYDDLNDNIGSGDHNADMNDAYELNDLDIDADNQIDLRTTTPIDAADIMDDNNEDDDDEAGELEKPRGPREIAIDKQLRELIRLTAEMFKVQVKLRKLMK
ncbi:hypothetical protein AIGOOFII_0322 [Methylobacterium marchantiae]|nr:hypothetical protein AIGOOFII_0322 [Methylobacterium marchantiae]